ncbi:MAG: cytochrome b [Roseateles sp.]|jgi:cytochrome b561
MTPSPRHRYDLLSIALHWLMALAIIGLLGVGLYMVSLPFSMSRLKLYNWHKWAGMTVLALAALRLLWSLLRQAPAAAPGPRWQQVAAHAVHGLLYLFFFAVPLAGWTYSSAAGFPIVWFGLLPLPDLVSPDPALAETLKATHRWLAYGLAAVVAAHVAAALKHQFLDRDRLLARMWPGRGA